MSASTTLPRPAASRVTSPTGTLLDSVLPAYEFGGTVSVTIRATPRRIFRALEEVTLAEMPLAGALGTLRYLPARLAGRRRTAPPAQPFLRTVLESGNLVLAADPDREVVIGVAGRLHNLLDQRMAALRDADEFARFRHPGYEQFVQSFRLAGGDAGRGYTLVAEHRTHALSPAARRKFAVYWWLLIRPGSAILLRLLLAAVRRRAERGDGAAGA